MERGRAGHDRVAPAPSSSTGSTAVGRGPSAASVTARRPAQALPSGHRAQATLQDKGPRHTGSRSTAGAPPEASAATSSTTRPSTSGIGSGSFAASPEVQHVPHPPVTRPGIDGLVPAGSLIRTTSLQQRQQQQQQREEQNLREQLEAQHQHQQQQQQQQQPLQRHQTSTTDPNQSLRARAVPHPPASGTANTTSGCLAARSSTAGQAASAAGAGAATGTSRLTRRPVDGSRQTLNVPGRVEGPAGRGPPGSRSHSLLRSLDPSSPGSRRDGPLTGGVASLGGVPPSGLLSRSEQDGGSNVRTGHGSEHRHGAGGRAIGLGEVGSHAREAGAARGESSSSGDSSSRVVDRSTAVAYRATGALPSSSNGIGNGTGVGGGARSTGGGVSSVSAGRPSAPPGRPPDHGAHAPSPRSLQHLARPASGRSLLPSQNSSGSNSSSNGGVRGLGASGSSPQAARLPGATSFGSERGLARGGFDGVSACSFGSKGLSLGEDLTGAGARGLRGRLGALDMRRSSSSSSSSSDSNYGSLDDDSSDGLLHSSAQALEGAQRRLGGLGQEPRASGSPGRRAEYLGLGGASQQGAAESGSSAHTSTLRNFIHNSQSQRREEGVGRGGSSGGRSIIGGWDANLRGSTSRDPRGGLGRLHSGNSRPNSGFMRDAERRSSNNGLPSNSLFGSLGSPTREPELEGRGSLGGQSHASPSGVSVPGAQNFQARFRSQQAARDASRMSLVEALLASREAAMREAEEAQVARAIAASLGEDAPPSPPRRTSPPPMRPRSPSPPRPAQPAPPARDRLPDFPFPAHPLLSLLAGLSRHRQQDRESPGLGGGPLAIAELLSALRAGLEDRQPSPTGAGVGAGSGPERRGFGGRALLIHAGGGGPLGGAGDGAWFLGLPGPGGTLSTLALGGEGGLGLEAMLGLDNMSYERLTGLEDVKTPAPPEVINSMRVTHYQSPSDKGSTSDTAPCGDAETCAVCIQEYEPGEAIMHLPCKHAFHDQCVRSWLSTYSKLCPVCKASVVGD
ncbi:hypothetical protein DUNSADRAFT_18251 [Dunaliella salina]|uniref:RING-type domain-containing protein n=1 Tax=Dunaliella salina TaxID=3046 RepID=A0ABQ7G0F4_DUNSA|nr:hypothetical protein DUNSADRAFT_18251 [Dunaliella salina]|eukprot:KAF5828088.1 hypothetical protein DUNSADRAFT_18251 [Dunaliella salina]